LEWFLTLQKNKGELKIYQRKLKRLQLKLESLRVKLDKRKEHETGKQKSSAIMISLNRWVPSLY
jgi:hypothetical protein